MNVATPTAFTVFVHGTLLAGQAHHDVIPKNIARTPAVLKESAVLFNFKGQFPILVLERDYIPEIVREERHIKGELVEVDTETFYRINRLEGYFGPDHPQNLYNRSRVTVQTSTGDVEAYVFHMTELQLAKTVKWYASVATVPEMDVDDWRKRKNVRAR